MPDITRMFNWIQPWVSSCLRRRAKYKPRTFRKFPGFGAAVGWVPLFYLEEVITFPLFPITFVVGYVSCLPKGIEKRKYEAYSKEEEIASDPQTDPAVLRKMARDKIQGKTMLEMDEEYGTWLRTPVRHPMCSKSSQKSTLWTFRCV